MAAVLLGVWATQAPLAKEVRVALDAVSRASHAAARMQRLAVASARKADASPVTVADFTVQAFVLSSLAEEFPADRFIAEETSREFLAAGASVRDAVVHACSELRGGATEQSVCDALDLGATGAVDGWSRAGRTWVLDPIDGTKGFVRGDQFAIALALLDEGQPRLGFLGCPRADRPVPGGVIFWAQRGHGAFYRRLDAADQVDTPIRTDPVTAPELVVPCEAAEASHTSFSQSAAALVSLGFDKTPPIRIDGQGKYGLVGCGEAHVYTRLPRSGYVENIWDHAAGACIVEEAGGCVTDLDGNPLDFSLGATLGDHVKGIVATNGPVLHKLVLRALATEGAS
ncbi:hypothetical protein AB1Y20_023571 [Prymnesium parvum]|uniref:3'(2'),5'-bisphosphate nucleotidase n=1 Tax=Prymnesium parvum TaxID=97485 RepID=A0AB34JF48_PRYPA